MGLWGHYDVICSKYWNWKVKKASLRLDYDGRFFFKSTLKQADLLANVFFICEQKSPVTAARL